ncbi:hypothetical protein [Pseudonocardia sp. HH130630-07]|uniref:hypothetical protein n=1 Tax=Pseudonocardia sp. HH130630-07 TaxID=1690815 RepID=UPI000814E636|nr:hypothetical protein [Pseudonocardia sp. HH130630-07]ANY07988.1 hypothetical protein AFB00_18685 [Pseudonocardia sp. HH130630-07]
MSFDETAPAPIDRDVQSGVLPASWRGLSVFAVRSAAAPLLDQAIAGVARGLEVLEVVVLDTAQRARAAAVLPPAALEGVPAGEPYAFVIAVDVFAADPAIGARPTERRVADVLDYTWRRVLRTVPVNEWFTAVQVSRGPDQAWEFLAALADEDLAERLRLRLAALGSTCAMPFPVVSVLGGTSPGFRAQVALVDHPEHGRTVCKIFRPGAVAAFERELRARRDLGDLPEVPKLLDHGPNWMLAPFYGDTGQHVVRQLPDELAQLDPDVVRTLLRFCRDLHDRGRFVMDLSPHNLTWDPHAGLKVLDLEFVLDYPVQPSWEDCWSLRGVPASYRAASDGLPDLLFTRGVGNSVFHPAVSGLTRRRLLGDTDRWEEVRRTVTQLVWFSALGTVGRLHPALRGRP